MKFKQYKRKEHPSLWNGFVGILESNSYIKYLKQIAF